MTSKWCFFSLKHSWIRVGKAHLFIKWMKKVKKGTHNKWNLSKIYRPLNDLVVRIAHLCFIPCTKVTLLQTFELSSGNYIVANKNCMLLTVHNIIYIRFFFVCIFTIHNHFRLKNLQILDVYMVIAFCVLCSTA